MARKKIKSITDQRPFVMIYHDFLENDLLTSHEKMVFIALKKFADSNNQCFPSLKKLANITRMSKRKIQDTLRSLEQKHIIDIDSRSRTDGGDASNFYTLHDLEELWSAGSSEEMAAIVDEIEEKRMIDILTAKGYYISKAKELASDTDQSTDTSTYVNSINIDKDKDTIKKPESQAERYTLDQIYQLFDYRAMVNDNPYEKQEIDSVMGILHNVMNTTKPTIRIFSEDRPAMAVIGKLMKLDKDSIMYAIKKFSEQTERITNPTAYMLTILYTAPEQYNLDIQNQVSHNMADWKTRG